MTDQIAFHIAAERLGYREEHTAVTHCISAHIIEIAIRVCLVVVVKTVGTQQPDDGLVAHLRFGDIGKIYASRITLELNVEPELIFLNLRSQIIHILHHQRPVALPRIIAGVLQRFNEKCLMNVSNIARKLAYLIGSSPISILVGDGQNLVSLQRSTK